MCFFVIDKKGLQIHGKDIAEKIYQIKHINGKYQRGHTKWKISERAYQRIYISGRTYMDIKYNDNNEIELPIYESLDDTIDALETIFCNWGDIVRKRFEMVRKGTRISMFIIYIDGLADNEMVERTITRPLLYEWRDEDFMPDICERGNEDGRPEGMNERGNEDGVSAGMNERGNEDGVPAGMDEREKDDSKNRMHEYEHIFHNETEAVDIVPVNDMQGAVKGILQGDTAIFIDGQRKALMLSTKKYPARGVGNPEKESGLKGPKDSFNENLRVNTALIRRRIKDPKLKLVQRETGQRTRTVYGIMYMEDLVREELLERVDEKLNSFVIDGILDSGMLVHLLEDKWYSPFPQVQTTERPDKAASAILEGRVVLVVDNSPEVLILPATLNSFFQAADDYYNRFAVGTFARIIRYIAAYISVLLPGLYVAVTCFYPQVLPTDFLLAIVGARNNVTFPVVVEVLLMEFLFELLREAGIRLPGQMGNTIGVVGGLIVGQAAVDASLVSTIVVIVVALTAICSFAIPNEEFASTFRLLKFVNIVLGAVLGLYGILLGILVIQIHLASLESFGIPYMLPLAAGTIDNGVEYQDFVLRKPVFSMRKRPVYTRAGKRLRFYRKSKGGN